MPRRFNIKPLPTGGFPEEALRKRPDWKVNNGLLEAIKHTVPKDKTIIDIGSGTGRYVRNLAVSGYRVIGIDGGENVQKITKGLIKQFDLTGDCSKVSLMDWGLLLDVGEHIPRDHEGKLISNISLMVRQGLIITWGSNRSYGHVNRRSPEYVVDKFSSYGWTLNKDLTKKARSLVGKKYCKRLLVLCRDLS